MEVLYRLSYRGIFRLCGGGRIRTSVGEAGRFTVCSLWPLGHTPGHAPAALCAERPNLVANATDFSTDEKGLRGPQTRAREVFLLLIRRPTRSTLFPYTGPAFKL